MHFIKSSAAEAAIFQENKVNTMATDALAPCVTRSSVTLLLIVGHCFPMRNDLKYMCNPSVENDKDVNIFFLFPKINSAQQS